MVLCIGTPVPQPISRMYRVSVEAPATLLKSADKAAKSPRSRTYKIQEGDLLSTIARNHLGKASRWPEIQKLNPQIDPAHLTLGDTIRLPVK